MERGSKKRGAARAAALLAVIGGGLLLPRMVFAEQPPAPCHANPQAAQDEAAVRSRGDVASLPPPLQDRLAQLANRPHSQPPTQAYAEADGASQLFQYYLLDTSGFQPNVFTTLIPGVNDKAQLMSTAWAPIPGLYACGEMVGVLFHTNYPGGTGLMSGAVFGRLAGAHAAGE